MIAVYLCIFVCVPSEVASVRLKVRASYLVSKRHNGSNLTDDRQGNYTQAVDLLGPVNPIAGALLTGWVINDVFIERPKRKRNERSKEIKAAIDAIVQTLGTKAEQGKNVLAGENIPQKIKKRAAELRSELRWEHAIWDRSSPLQWLADASDDKINEFLSRLPSELEFAKVYEEDDPNKTEQKVVLAFMAIFAPPGWKIEDQPAFTKVPPEFREQIESNPFNGVKGWDDEIEGARGAFLLGRPEEFRYRQAGRKPSEEKASGSKK